MTHTALQGRQLDREIAERIMGLKIVDVPFIPRDVVIGRDTLTDEASTVLRTSYPNAAIFRTIPAYSSSIEAAWEVVERVQELQPGWRFDILGGDISYAYQGDKPPKIDYGRTVGFGWHASFFGHIDPAENYGDRHGEGWADTPALAICRASLAALAALQEEKTKP